jgi:WD40 repeat protein
MEFSARKEIGEGFQKNSAEELFVCEKVLNAHLNEVICLVALTNRRIASGSRDETVKIWNVLAGVCEKTLIGHGDPVTCILELSPQKLACGSGSHIQIWDITSGKR